MAETARSLLVLPISPSEPGNGLAHRSRFWEDVLARIGAVTTVVVPVSGPARDGDVEVSLEAAVTSELLPVRSRRAPERLGRGWAAAHEPFDVVMAVRADVALFALGAASGTDALVVVDLDDDDAGLHAALGDAAEAARYERIVREIRTRADLVTSVSGFGGTTPVPNAVERPAQAVGRPSPGTDRILMVGNFTYQPNVDGARWLLDEVLPQITVERPGAQVVLVGPGSEALPGGLGFVDDLAAEHAAASVAVVPLRHGSGSRIKALQAFAAGVPVVGTTVGLDGLPVTDGVDCLIADGAPELAAAVVRLLADDGLGARLAAAARDGIARALDRRKVVEGVVVVIEAAGANRARRALTWASGLTPTETEDGLVVMDDYGMVAHHLNSLAAAVLVLVDGEAEPSTIAADVADAFGLDVTSSRAAVDAALAELVAAGLLVSRRRPERE